MGDNNYVRFPDHLSLGGHFGVIDQATMVGGEFEWGFLRLDRNFSLNLGFSYDRSISPAGRQETNLWSTDISRYAGHVGASYRLEVLPGRTFSLGISPMMRLFFGAQTYTPRVSEDLDVLRQVCEQYGRFNSTTGSCSHPEDLEPYPRNAPNGTNAIVGLQAGGDLFFSINADRIINGMGWVDLYLGVMGDTSGGILFHPGLRGNWAF